jgi:hypothetical protein
MESEAQQSIRRKRHCEEPVRRGNNMDAASLRYSP